MSKLKVFSVYDSKVEAYLQPFFLRSRGEAVRAFTDACRDPKTQFAQYPADFTLFEIADYDDVDGSLLPHSVKVSLGSSLELISKSNEALSIVKE
jgi:hypothetical protein